jgi:hypothetical protein
LPPCPRLAGPGKLKPFVLRIAHNRCVSHVARQMRERSCQEPLESFPTGEPGQEQALIQAERAARLLHAVQRLALPYRQVMTLILEEMSYEKIAETLAWAAIASGALRTASPAALTPVTWITRQSLIRRARSGGPEGLGAGRDCQQLLAETADLARTVDEVDLENPVARPALGIRLPQSEVVAMTDGEGLGHSR